VNTLFDQKLLCHKDDPDTSFEAAEKMIKSGALNRQEEQVWIEINLYVTSPQHLLDGTFTAKDLDDDKDINIGYYTIQRRLGGLRQKSKIERLNTEGTVYQENKGQKLMKRDKCCVWRLK